MNRIHFVHLLTTNVCCGLIIQMVKVVDYQPKDRDWNSLFGHWWYSLS